MTPDELRRMDNDECIIYEKGIKPVKAKKFYYFKKPMAKKMAELEISHNDIGEIDRGEWRKFNPYNPYVEEQDEKEVQNLQVESLDDLFEDIPSSNVEEHKEEKNEPNQTLNLNDFDENTQTEKIEDEETYDLQKELEAKFDELFGPMD